MADYIGRLMGDSQPTDLRDSFTRCVTRQSPDCQGSVGLVSAKCRLLVFGYAILFILSSSPTLVLNLKTRKCSSLFNKN